MTRLIEATAILLASVAAVGCSYRPTQALVYVDTNVSAERVMSLSIASAAGDVSIERLRASRLETARGDRSRPLFPGSFALVPKQGGPRGGAQSLLARLEVEATATQPALVIERYHRVALIERTPLDAYVRFNATCAASTTGCRTATGSACTVSLRCLEQGLTCGDDGACVAIELPTQPSSDAGPGFDATPDAAPSAMDASSEDAAIPAPDAMVDDSASRDVVADEAAAPVVVVAPRPIAPMSTSAVTSKRPTLRWQLAAGSDGASVELCRDRAMSAQCQSLRIAGDRVRPAAELGAGWWFWRLRGTQGAATGASASVVWQFRVGARSASGDRDLSWGVWPDFDGDGAGDVLVGAQGAQSGAGEATVWRATATTLVEQTSLRARGSAAGDRFGAAVATLGDINGDGYGDYAVGALAANASAGAVRVRFGGPSMLADATLSGVDHALPGAQFGASIAGLGDVDGDGYGDFAVGAPNANLPGCSGCGFVRVFFGGASGVSARTPMRMQGRAVADLFGSAVSGAGDFNGDGFADMVVGAPGSSPSGRAECGEVHLFAGSSAGFSSVADRVIECLAPGDIFGWSVSGAGDVNGDGLADFVVGAHNAQGGMPATIGGIAVVFEGALTASAVRLGVVLNGDVFDRQGWSVSSAGDVNGDGFSDIIVGAWAASPGGRNGTGVARLYAGSASGALAARARVIEGVAASDMLGRAVAGVGDLNRDGFDDVVLGAPAFDQTPLGRAGAIHVRLGSAAGLGATTWTIVAGAAIDDRFGGALAAAH